jgi:gliding motility-associated-like protein
MKHILFFSIFLLSFVESRATHFMGGEISYTLLDSNTRQYKIRLVLYRDCSGTANNLGATNNISVRNMCTNTIANVSLTKISGGTTGVDKTALCGGATSNCSGGSTPGLSQFIYEGNYNFPASCDSFKMFFQVQARNTATNNVIMAANNTWLYVESYIRFKQYNYNTSSRNDNLLLSVNFCNNSKSKFSFYSPDVNKDDSIVYELVKPREQNGLGMSYTGTPLPDSSHPTFDCGYQFNTQTGEYRFKPNQVQNSLVAVKIKEFHKGVLVGYVVREAQFIVSNTGGCGDLTLHDIVSTYCTTKKKIDTTVSGFGCYIDTSKVYDMVFCEGTPIELFISYQNAGKVYTNMDSYTGYGAMTDLDANKSDSIRDFKFTWGSPIFGNHNITLNINNCPAAGGSLKYTNSVTTTIRVLHSPRPSKDTIFYCLAGGAVDATMNNLDSGVTYKWNHKTGVTFPTSDSTKFKIAVAHDTTYIISYKYYGDTCSSCNNYDTIVVKYVPDFLYTATPDSSAHCIYNSQQLTVTPDGSAAPYKYKWSPYGKLLHPTMKAVLDSLGAVYINNPIADPNAGINKYYVSITSATGCELKDTFTVKVQDSIPTIFATPRNYASCSKDTVQLNTQLGIASSSVPFSPVVATFAYSTMGAGAVNYPASPGTAYPSIFGSQASATVKHRIMYKSAELAAIGVNNKNIKDISYLPKFIYGQNTYSNIEIKMAGTTLDTITANVPMTSVYTASSIFITPVWQVFPLNGNGFNVGANDNLIVEICFSNLTGTAANTAMESDLTAFNSVSWATGVGACTSNAWAGISNYRPRTRFNVGGAPLYPASKFKWTSGNFVPNDSVSNPKLYSTVPSNVYLISTNKLCSAYDTIHIHTDTTHSITASNDTFICTNVPIKLSASVTGIPMPGQTIGVLWKAIGGDTSMKDSTSFVITVKPNKTKIYVVQTTNGACVKYDTVIITRGPDLILNMVKKNNTCILSNGWALAYTTNGVGPFTYTWSNGASTDSIKNLINGKYKVTVMSSQGCYGYDSVILTPIVTNPLLSFNKTNPKCNGYSNGGIKVKTTAANTGPFSYTWTPVQPNSDTISNLSIGKYVVVVYDSATGCSSTDSVTLTQPTKLLVDADSTNVKCYGGSTGSVKAVVSGGTPLYSYAWSDASIGNIITGTNKPIGSWTVTVTDANGCIDSASTSINQPLPLSTIKEQFNPQCSGNLTGKAKITISGGTKPYTKAWLVYPIPSIISTTDSIFNKGVGIYHVVITDSNGCTKIDTFIITEPSPLFGGANILNNVTCFGGNNGNVIVNGVGGTKPYTYIWTSPPLYTNADSGLGYTKGAKTVTIKDTFGCQKIVNFTITESAKKVLSKFIINQVSCKNGNDGSAWINVMSGGIGPYTFTWSPTQPSNDTIFNLTAGKYVVLVSDSAGLDCFVKDSVTITEPTLLVANITSKVSISCFGGSNGIATVSSSGGTPFGSSPLYTLLWDNASTINPCTTLVAGNHVVTVTDAKGCTDTAGVFIVQPNKVVLSLASMTPVVCYGGKTGKVKVSAIGGVKPYLFNWVPYAYESDSAVDTFVASTIQVIVQDFNGCKDTLPNIVVTQPDSLKIITTTTNAQCYDSTGKIKLTITGGTGAYSYSWSNGSNKDSLVAKAGTYTVSVYDANSCMKTATVTILQPTTYVITKLIDSLNCFKDNTGKAKVIVSGNNPPYLYFWSDGSIKDSIENKESNTYMLTIIDGLGCLKFETFQISEPPVLDINIAGVSNILCYGQSSGTATVIAMGGNLNPDYIYNWSNGVNTSLNTSLYLGYNKVTVTDRKGCFDTAGVGITQPSLLKLSLVDTQSVNCWNDTIGQAIVSTIGGIYPYTYSWLLSSTDIDSVVNNLKVGIHKCVATDFNGCKDTLKNIIIQSPDSISVEFTIKNVICHDSLTGGIQTTVNGGSPPYTYAWTSYGSTNDSIKNKHAGFKPLQIKDKFNCLKQTGALIPEPSIFKDSFAIDSATCSGFLNGKAKLILTGNNIPYSYSWSDGSTKDSIVGKSSGTYTITATDNKGCKMFSSVFIPQPQSLNASIFSHLDLSCYNDSNGYASVFVTGGTIPYTYLWNNGGGASNVKNGMKAGFNVVTVTDNKGCYDTAGVVLTQPSILLSTLINSKPPLCYGDSNGEATIDVSGGVYPFSYIWTGTSETDSAVTSFKKGTWMATVTDAKGCKRNVNNIAITEPDSLKMVMSFVKTNCFGSSEGTAKVLVTGGVTPYLYSWNTGGTTDTLLNKPAGTYSVIVVDKNLCLKSQSIIITQPIQMISYNVKYDTVKCKGESNGNAYIHIAQGTPPYTYSWNTSPVQTDTIATNLPAGKYTSIATDTKGCKKIDTINITEPQPLLAIATISQPISCYLGVDGKILMSATGGNGYNGGYKYKLTGAYTSNPLYTGLSSNTYILSSKDLKGCEDTVSVFVNQPLPISNAIDKSNSSCKESNNGVAWVYNITGGNGGYTYKWSNGSNKDSSLNLSGLSKQFVTIYDSKNCFKKDSITVDTSYKLRGFTIQDSTSCYLAKDGGITANASNGVGGYTYLWSTSPPISTNVAINLGAGIYRVTVTDVNNCTAVLKDTVKQPSKLSISFVESQPLCFMSANGYLVTKGKGGTQPYSYTWNTSPPQNRDSATGLSAGIYQVTLSDINGCNEVASYTLGQPNQLLFVNLKKLKNVSCFEKNNGEISVEANGGFAPFTFLWDPTGDTSKDLKNLSANTSYKVEVMDSKGCKDTATYTLSQPDALAISGMSIKNVTCAGFKDGYAKVLVVGGTVNNANPYMASLDSITWQDNRIFQNLDKGSYKVFIKDINGCSEMTQFKIKEPAFLDVNIYPKDTIIKLGASVQLVTNVTARDGSTPYNNTYQWIPTIGLSCVDCLDPISTPYITRKYKLLVVQNGRCEYSGETFIHVSIDSLGLFIPSGFTPNGDGMNDLFEVYGEGIEDMEMRVFDRYGERVFFGTGINAKWDGIYLGSDAVFGQYTYHIKLTYLNGESRIKTGTITLIR